MTNAVQKVDETLPAQAVPDSAAIIQVIERAASNPNIDVEKMERLLNMQMTIMDRNASQEFNVAMNAVQSEMVRISADASNPQTRSKYASYAALDRALRPIYGKHGFSLSFGTGDGAPENYVRVTCDVGHVGGHTKTYHIDMPADGKGAKGGDVMTKTHAVGAGTSYGARYLLKLIFNIAVGEDDTDGNAPRDMTPITEQQEATISAKMKEVGANEKAFLVHLGVEKISDLPATKFNHAMSSLASKARQKAGAK